MFDDPSPREGSVRCRAPECCVVGSWESAGSSFISRFGSRKHVRCPDTPGLCNYVLRLMDKILHDPKDPKLWELWYIPYYGSCRILSISRIKSDLLSGLGFSHSLSRSDGRLGTALCQEDL